MSDLPEWLPEIISVDGEWENVLQTLYSIFRKDFVDGNLKLNNAPVWWDRRVLENDQYEEGFWHLISKDDDSSNDRLFDPRRVERLPWCRPTIDHFNEDVVRYWDYKTSKSRIVTYLWLEDFDYVIIFQKRKLGIGTVYFLKTAYYVEGDSTRKNLQKNYEKREL